MRSSRVLLLAGAIFALAVGVLAYRALLSNSAATAEAAVQLLRLSLPDVDGRPQSLSQWPNKLLVVNFWATWCEPCRREVPGMVRIQAAYAPKGVQVVGIALDTPAKVREFAREYAVNYALVIGGMEIMDLSRKLGNNAAALPYTVVLDRSGKIVTTHLGAMSETELERIIKPVTG